ncbi:MAG: sodium/proline symporter [Kofleriaceae bacterium]
MSVVVVSFLACIAGFAVIGGAAAAKARGSAADYLVASRSVSPWLTALSSAATNNSGFMFIGLFGFTYRFGVQAVWLQAGWILGDVIAWLWIHRRVRARAGELDASSVPRLLATDEAGATSRAMVVVIGALTLLFLGGYAAAQLKAGSAALSGMFGWAPWIGISIGAVIVVVYCIAGGLRASIWTDAAQALVMIGALVALLVFAMAKVGGPGALASALAAEDPALVRWLPDGLAFGLGVYWLGFVFGGLGAIGQPHILIRSMAIESEAGIGRARLIYFLWYVPFSIAAVATGLYARVLVPDLTAGVDAAAAAVAAEASLPAVANLLLPDVLLGLLLAGVFAATMSTADSQILACSAAITQDVVPRWRTSLVASKLATLSVAALALGIALWADAAVFRLVLAAWSALGATLGPVLIVRLARRPLPPWLGVVMIAAGLGTVFTWATPYGGDAFELLPGMLVPLALYGVATLAGLVRPAPSRA